MLSIASLLELQMTCEQPLAWTQRLHMQYVVCASVGKGFICHTLVVTLSLLSHACSHTVTAVTCL